MNYKYVIWRWKKQYRIDASKNMNNNLSFFQTRSRFLLSRLRRDRDLYFLYLVLRDEIENLFQQISNFEKRTKNKKGFLVVEREFSLLNLTRFFEIEKSRHALIYTHIYYPGKCTTVVKVHFFGKTSERDMGGKCQFIVSLIVAG